MFEMLLTAKEAVKIKITSHEGEDVSQDPVFRQPFVDFLSEISPNKVGMKYRVYYFEDGSTSGILDPTILEIPDISVIKLGDVFYLDSSHITLVFENSSDATLFKMMFL